MFDSTVDNVAANVVRLSHQLASGQLVAVTNVSSMPDISSTLPTRSIVDVAVSIHDTSEGQPRTLWALIFHHHPDFNASAEGVPIMAFTVPDRQSPVRREAVIDDPSALML
jgi:hypothetical protein